MNLTNVNESTYICGFFVSENSSFIKKPQILCVGSVFMNFTYYILLLRSGCWNTTQGF